MFVNIPTDTVIKGMWKCLSFDPVCCLRSRGVAFPARIEEQNGLSQTGLPSDLSVKSLQSNRVAELC